MALKDKFTGKRARGLIVNRHRQLHAGEASSPAGQYLARLTDNLPPVVGTVSGGYVGIADVADGITFGSAGALMTFSDIANFSLADNSLILLAQLKMVAGQQPVLTFGNNQTSSFTNNFLSLSAATVATSALNLVTDGASSISDAGVAAAAGTFASVLVAYDATTRGGVYATGAGVITPLTGTLPVQSVSFAWNRLWGGDLFDAGNPITVRHIHFIKFPGAGLPANMQALFDAYVAAPGLALSAWAA